MTIPFIATEVSGLTSPSHPTAATNKLYVDTISSNTQLWATGEFAPTGTLAWAVLNDLSDVTAPAPASGLALVWNGVSWIPSVVSGQAAGSLTDLTIDTDKDWQLYGIYNINYLSSQSIFSDSYLGTWLGNQIKESQLVSGTSYHSAVLSSQALKDPAFADFGNLAGDVASGNHTHSGLYQELASIASGWAYISSNTNIAHTLSAKPVSHYVLPSGDIAFAVSTKVDATNINVKMTAPGKRDIHWHAEV